jgi:hypothetical protein
LLPDVGCTLTIENFGTGGAGRSDSACSICPFPSSPSCTRFAHPSLEPPEWSQKDVLPHHYRRYPGSGLGLDRCGSIACIRREGHIKRCGDAKKHGETAVIFPYLSPCSFRRHPTSVQCPSRLMRLKKTTPVKSPCWLGCNPAAAVCVQKKTSRSARLCFYRLCVTALLCYCTAVIGCG